MATDQIMQKYKDRTPYVGNLELTYQCPFNCAFCYNYSTNEKELTTSEIVSLIDQFANEGCMLINLSGGEPLLHPDFLKIYMHAKKNGMHVSIESNLYHIPDGFIDMIKEYPVDMFQISLYGVTKETFQSVTKTKLNYKVVLENIELLLKNEIEFILRTPVSKDVLHELGQIVDYCNTNKIKHKYDPNLFWTQCGRRTDELCPNLNEIEKYKKSHKVYNKLYEYVEKRENTKFEVRSCRWGLNEFYINPYGQMFFCTVWWTTKFDVKNGSFSHVWHDIIGNMRKIENDYCVGKIAAGTGDVCPAGSFQMDKTIDLALSIRDRLIEKQLDIDKFGNIIDIV